MPPRLLLINPNTSSWVTQALAVQIQSVVGNTNAFALDLATATLGASYIATEASYVIAGHALLDCYAANANGHNAVIVGCFGDPGAEALREMSGLPVIGMAEAAMQEASSIGQFSIVTGGQAWKPMLLRLTMVLGYHNQLTDVVAVSESAAELAKNRAKALDTLELACEQAGQGGAKAIILGGAAFAGYGDELARRTGLAVIDSVSATARAMLKLASGLTGTSAAPPGTRPNSGASYSGVSRQLTALLEPSESVDSNLLRQ